MAEPESITLNGIVYPVADLSEEAKNQITNVQLVDAEIGRLHRQLAIAQTARNAYAAALAASVPPAKVNEQ